MGLLATMIPDACGVCDIYSQTTYGGGQIPFGWDGRLTLSEVLNEPMAPYSCETYERAVMLITGSLDDQ